MNRYEKNVMKLMEAHEKIPKVVLITNVTQGKKKQREFLDRLYLERINKQEMEKTENEQTTY